MTTSCVWRWTRTVTPASTDVTNKTTKLRRRTGLGVTGPRAAQTRYSAIHPERHQDERDRTTDKPIDGRSDQPSQLNLGWRGGLAAEPALAG